MKIKVVKHLTLAYYGMILLAVAVATLMFYIVRQTDFTPLDRYSNLGIGLQYFVIFYVVLSVAGGLYWFKKECDKLKKLQDEDLQLQQYEKKALVRIIVIGLGISLGILGFYLLGGYYSLLWCAGISAIGLVFCKPQKRRIELELLNEEQL